MKSHVILTGGVVRDPELRYSQNGNAITDVSMAWNQGWGERESSNFIDCTMFGKSAETAAKYLSKGSPIQVWGELVQERWEDKESGQKRSKHKVIANGFKMLPKGSGQESREEATAAPAATEDDLPF